MSGAREDDPVQTITAAMLRAAVMGEFFAAGDTGNGLGYSGDSEEMVGWLLKSGGDAGALSEEGLTPGQQLACWAAEKKADNEYFKTWGMLTAMDELFELRPMDLAGESDGALRAAAALKAIADREVGSVEHLPRGSIAQLERERPTVESMLLRASLAGGAVAGSDAEGLSGTKRI